MTEPTTPTDPLEPIQAVLDRLRHTHATRAWVHRDALNTALGEARVRLHLAATPSPADTPRPADVPHWRCASNYAGYDDTGTALPCNCTPPADVTKQAREDVTEVLAQALWRRQSDPLERRAYKFEDAPSRMHYLAHGKAQAAALAAARHTSEAEAGARALDDAARYAPPGLTDWLRDRAAALRAGGAWTEAET